jgi:type IV secretion system protein VirB4
MALGEQAVVPALNFLFHRIEAAFDGSPTLLILDEAWTFLRHSTFQRRLQNWLKTLRKKNVYVVFATQEVADAVSNPIMPTILANCPTQIILPDPDALSEGVKGYYRQLNLSETEMGILATAQKKRDYYYRSTKGRRLFKLDLDPVALTFAGMSAPADHKFMDEMVKSVPPAQHAQALLRYRKLDWAARLIDEASCSGRRTFAS